MAGLCGWVIVRVANVFAGGLGYCSALVLVVSGAMVLCCYSVASRWFLWSCGLRCVWLPWVVAGGLP